MKIWSSGQVALERFQVIDVVDLVSTTELHPGRVRFFGKAAGSSNHGRDGHRGFVKSDIAGLVHRARDKRLEAVVARHADIHLRVIQDLVGKALGNFDTEFLCRKASRLEFTRIRVEQLAIRRHLLPCGLVLPHRGRQFRMFPDHHLDHIQRANAVFRSRQRIHNKVGKVAQSHGISRSRSRLPKIAIVDGMQDNLDTIIGRRILGHAHTHLRSGKATVQDNGGGTQHQQFQFFHFAVSLCLIFSTQ